MFNLASLFKPLTSQPVSFNEEVRFIPPCDALKPFVSGYWGTRDAACGIQPYKPILVISDARMDIIFDVNHTTNKVDGFFTGMIDTPFTDFYKKSEHLISRFSISFHFWAVHLFADFHLHGSSNSLSDMDIYFKGWRTFFTEMLLNTLTIEERIKKTDIFLKSKLNTGRCENNIMNAAYHILSRHGSARVKDVCESVCISQRQLERRFKDYIGISIKKASSLVRYQNVWRDAAYLKDFDVSNAVEKYGYTDQSHLLNEFKRYHGITLGDAKNLLAK